MLYRVRSRSYLMIGCLALVAMAPVAAFEDGKVGLTPLEVARIRTVGEVAISPDGEQIAYTLSVPRDPLGDDDGAAWSRLLVVDFEGGEPRTFVGGEVNVSHVRWSPDGSHLTYLSRRDGDSTTAVWAIPLAGGESTSLVSYDSSISTYEWRPDGMAVAFIAGEPMTAEARSLRDRGYDQEIYEEDVAARRVFTVELPHGAAGEAAEPVVHENLPGHAYNVAWSPDGTTLLVDPAPTPLVDDRYMYRRVQILNATNGQVEASIDNPGKLGAFAMAPDGETVVMISAADINDPMEGRLMAITPASERMSDLLPGLMGHVASFSFLPDGHILYLANVGTETELGTVAVDGSDARVLMSGTGMIVDAFSAETAGNRVALVVESPASPRELWAVDLRDALPSRRPTAGASTITRLTDSNPWLADVTLADQEVVRWDAADGLEIEGLLMHPLERAEGERVPLIVVAHGGPESHYKNGWLTGYSSPGQMAAARGYAVLYPNYRGSTGRGVEFAKADQGDGMGAEFEDNLAGIDWLIETGLVDGDRVGITGGSYGGYATAWAATKHSERFAAGVMFVGISNQLSKTGTSDIPREMELVHWLSNPYDNPELFLDRSPVTHVGNARTPLLILHGKEDPRVNPGQSREMYRALKMKGDVPVRLVLYPDEGHGNRLAAHRYDYNLRMLRWFDHFLMQGNTELPDPALDYGLEKEPS